MKKEPGIGEDSAEPQDSAKKKKDKKVGRNRDKIQCFLCRHVVKNCPQRSGTNHLGGRKPDKGGPLRVMPGLVGDREVADILIDPGATFSVVAKDLLLEDWSPTGYTFVETPGGPCKQYPTVGLQLQVEGKRFSTRMAVWDRADLRRSVILGSNLGADIWDFGPATTSKVKASWTEVGEELAGELVPQGTPETGVSGDGPDSRQGDRPDPQLVERPDPGVSEAEELTVVPDSRQGDRPDPQPVERPDPGVSEAEELTVVQTRAAIRREALQQKANETAMRDSEVELTSCLGLKRMLIWT